MTGEGLSTLYVHLDSRRKDLELRPCIAQILEKLSQNSHLRGIYRHLLGLCLSLGIHCHLSRSDLDPQYFLQCHWKTF